MKGCMNYKAKASNVVAIDLIVLISYKNAEYAVQPKMICYFHYLQYVLHGVYNVI